MIKKTTLKYPQLETLLFLLIVINVVFDTLAIYLLRALKRNGIESTYLINILNISCTDLMSCLISSSYLILNNISSSYPVPNWLLGDLVIMDIYLVYMVYLLSMVFIVMDKLLEIVLSLRYPTLWNERKSRNTIYCIWVFALMLCTGCLIWHHIQRRDCTAIQLQTYLRQMFYLPFLVSIFCTVFAFFSFSYIFYKFNKSRLAPYQSRRRQSSAVKLSLFTTFRKSRFFLPLVLIIIFILSRVLPTILYGRQVVAKYEGLVVALGIINMGSLLECWLCIFLQTDVKRYFRRIFIDRREHRESVTSSRRYSNQSIHTIRDNYQYFVKQERVNKRSLATLSTNRYRSQSCIHPENPYS